MSINNTLTIRIFRTNEDLKLLQNDWKELSTFVSECPIYGQPKLLSLWWDNFGVDTDRPFVLKRGINIAGDVCTTESIYTLVAYIKEKIVAILPLMLLNVRPHGEDRYLKCLSFLGDFIFNPTPAIICTEDYAEIAINGFVNHFQKSEEWDAFLLTSLRQDFNKTGYFLNALSQSIPGKMMHFQLEEVRFARCWDRGGVLNRIKELLKRNSNCSMDTQLKQIVNEIEQMDNPKFIRRCLPDITPRLKAVLDIYKKEIYASRELIADIHHDISPVSPFILQIFQLPDMKEKLFDLFSSGNKKHSIKRKRQLCHDAGYYMEIQDRLSEKELKRFIELHHLRFPNSVHFNYLTIEYYRKLLEIMSEDDTLFWVVVRSKNCNAVFFGLCFIDNNTKTIEYVISAGERQNINFGYLAIVAAMEKGIELGCVYFSFRMGTERYKARFHPKSIPLESFILSKDEKGNLPSLLPKQFLINETFKL
jgi:hypothetical protein